MSALSVVDQSTSIPEIETFSGGLRARLLVQEDRIEAVAERDRAERSPLSPELVLVCPELREFALQQLPERDPDWFLSSPAREQPPEDTVGAAVDTSSEVGESEAPADPPLVVSLLAYTVQQSVNMALHGVGVIAAMTGLVLLLTQFHR